MRELSSLISTLALLAACEARPGKEADDGARGAKIAAGAAAAPAEGKAEAGRLSINVSGFDMKIDIPGGMTSHGDGKGDSGLLYPGSTLSGMHIEGSRGNGERPRNAGVELRFTTPDALDRVAGWYRHPAQAARFTVASVRREGDALVVAGSEKQDGDPFSLRLRRQAGGGTEGRLTLSDRS